MMLAFYLFFFQPIPFYMEVPGGAFGLDEMVEIDQEFSDEPGDFYITTVSIQQVTPFTALSSFLPFRDLVSEAQLFGEIDDFEEYNKIQKFYMDSSINTAVQAAFEAAELDYEMQYNGVYVLQVLENSTFFDDLQIGDVVKAVDGKTFQNSQSFIEYIGERNVGDTVQLEFERDGELLTASGELILLETGAAGIGIGLVDDTRLETDPSVTIHSGTIGGPSAGLMFSLQIYNQLIDEDIRGGFDIAGTGTIDSEGNVGRIGGVEKKVIAADNEGADYFFAPDDEITEEMRQFYPDIQSNYQAAVDAAEAIDTDMEIVPVKNLSDAIIFLEELRLQEAAQNTGAIYDLSTGLPVSVNFNVKLVA